MKKETIEEKLCIQISSYCSVDGPRQAVHMNIETWNKIKKVLELQHKAIERATVQLHRSNNNRVSMGTEAQLTRAYEIFNEILEDEE